MKKAMLFFSLVLPFCLFGMNSHAKLIDDGGFFDDFEPQDTIITNGTTLRIRSGGTLDLQSGSIFNVSGDLTITNTSDTAFRVQTTGGAATVFQVDTDTTSGQHVTVTTSTDNSTAFIVEDALGQDIFVVDTVSGGITVNSDSGADSFVVADAQTLVTTQTDATDGFVVDDVAGQNIFQVDTLAGGITVTSDDNNPLMTVADAGTDIDTVVNGAGALAVRDSGDVESFSVNTSTESVAIRNDITFSGAEGPPVIDVTTGGRIEMFDPASSPGSNALHLNGDISIAGDLFNEAFIDLGFQVARVENNVTEKFEVLSALEKQVELVNQDMTIIKEAGFTPEAVTFAKTALDRKLGSRDIERLISGKASSADALHTHTRFPKDVIFEKDILVEGDRAYVRKTDDNQKIVTFVQESSKALLSDTGFSRLKDGEAHIPLDPRFLEIVSVNDASPYFIQLTASGDCEGLYVAEKTHKGFVVKELRSGTSNVGFFWRIEATKRGLEGVEYVTVEDYQNLKK